MNDGRSGIAKFQRTAPYTFFILLLNNFPYSVDPTRGNNISRILNFTGQYKFYRWVPRLYITYIIIVINIMPSVVINS